MRPGPPSVRDIPSSRGLSRAESALYNRNMSSRKEHSDDGPISDPRVLRAVAHPVRLDLLELLHSHGPLTASRCGELLGLSPKVCSYHLTVLGKYGLIEETGEGRGRARPWRPVIRDLIYRHEADQGRSVLDAENELARTLLARDARRIEQFIAHRDELPPLWRNTAAMTSRPLRLTAPQLAALRNELTELLDRYARSVTATGDTDDAGSQGSAGADIRPVHVAVYAVPMPSTGTEQ